MRFLTKRQVDERRFERTKSLILRNFDTVSFSRHGYSTPVPAAQDDYRESVPGP